MPFHTASRQEMKDLCSINPWMVRSNRFDDMFFDSSGQNTAVSSDKKLQKNFVSGKSARKKVKVKTFSHTRTSREREGGTEQGQPATTKQKRNQSKTTKAENGKGSTQKAGRTKEGKGGEGGRRKHTGSQPWQAKEQQHKAEPATEQNHSKGKGQTQS